MNAPQLDQIKKQIKQMNTLKQQILEYGMAVVADGGDHGTFYTVGASWYGFPDMIMKDVKARHALHIMNSIFQYWEEHGYAEGRITGIFESKDTEGMDMPVDVKLIEYSKDLMREVPLGAKFYATEKEFVHPEHGIRYAQIFPPDDKGKTQLEAGFDMRYHQTLVGTKKTVN